MAKSLNFHIYTNQGCGLGLDASASISSRTNWQTSWSRSLRSRAQV